MNSIIDFITENDVTIMVSLLLLIVVLTIIVLILDLVNGKKNSVDATKLFVDTSTNMTDAFNEKINNSDDLEYATDLRQYDPILNIENNNVTEIKYVEDDEELEKTKAQLELKALKEELLKAEQEEVEKNSQAIEENNSTEIIDLNEIANGIKKYESDQEKNAIISLDEFNLVSDKVYDKNEETQYTDEGNEPISIKELEELYNTKELKSVSNIEDTTIKIDKEIPNEKSVSESPSKFKSTPIISPVYGLNRDDITNTVNLENTGNYDKLSEEIRKTNEFLNTLRELRKNLQ